ncbi:hypothetical protein CAR_c15430 [Carnobacterium sp. 17-4]|uniref:hypothetical protein n=1 Tax=Carnobacterium sp. (strain 17-4) TaxID=208596 RepID=UPI0002058DE8|nr:hypothetical protein [Carnobacterium sp. 17-4]AEB30202.1 hypothetical protein CAR_c15430 [Carnobacterium sp. 17-4]
MINKITKNRTITNENILFYSAYAMMVISSSLIVNIESRLFYATKIISVLLFISTLFLQKTTPKTIIKKLIIVIIIVIVFYQTKSISLLYFTVAVIASKNIKLEKIAYLDVFFRFSGLFITITLFLLGIIEEYNLYRIDEGVSSIRHSLGYAHPNTLFMHVFIIAIDIIVLRYNKLNFKTLLILNFFLGVFSNITSSRTGMIVFICLSILIFLQKKFNILNKSKIIRIIITYSISIFTLSTYFLVYAYNNSSSLVYILDTMITGRIRSAAYYWNTYGLSILGQPTNRLSTIDALLTNQRAYILDNVYFNLLISQGVVFTIIYIVLYTKLIKKLFNEKNEIAILLIFTFFVYGLTEGIPLNIEFNYTALLLGNIIAQKKLSLKKTMVIET